MILLYNFLAIFFISKPWYFGVILLCEKICFSIILLLLIIVVCHFYSIHNIKDTLCMCVWVLEVIDYCTWMCCCKSLNSYYLYFGLLLAENMILYSNVHVHVLFYGGIYSTVSSCYWFTCTYYSVTFLNFYMYFNCIYTVYMHVVGIISNS